MTMNDVHASTTTEAPTITIAGAANEPLYHRQVFHRMSNAAN
jgi:hypothetical protein